MRLIKKVAMLSAFCIGLSNCVPTITIGKTAEQGRILPQIGFKGNELYAYSYGYSTNGIYYGAPSFRLYQETKNSETYIHISVDQGGMNVYVDGSSSGVVQQDAYNYTYRVTKGGTYQVTVSNWNGGGSRTDSINVSMSNYSTSLELSKEYRNGDCYLIIKGKDDDGIKRVTVNDNSISFSEYSGEASYRIYNSGTYTVKLTDRKDNTRTESIYINVNSNVPSLSLSKTQRSGKWYLSIKADADNRIDKVTVNGKSISFPSSGGTEEYEVTKTDTYKVVVRDREGLTRTESLYIDINENTSTKPVVKVSQNYKTNNTPGWYLLISAKSNASIASVTVNGVNVPYDAAQEMAQYYVPVEGTYTIVVTDSNGNSTSTSTYAAGNAGLVNNSSVDSNASSMENVTIMFKLNSKMWTKNGAVQEQMSTPLKSINSRVYLPIRYAAYALGIDKSKIVWDQNSKTVTIYDGAGTIKVKVGSKKMEVNGKTVTMDVAPVANGGRVMLPISQITSAFSSQNIRLDWDNKNKQLIIKR